MLFLIVAPDVGLINSSLRILSVNVSGGRASFTLTFDVSDLLLKIHWHICMHISVRTDVYIRVIPLRLCKHCFRLLCNDVHHCW